MLYPNGRLPVSTLVSVAPGMILRSTTAIAYNNAKRLADLIYDSHMGPAGKYGAGYRDMEAMTVFFRASKGDHAAMAKAGIDPGLQISVAAPPNSSHAQATRADLLFNGRTANERETELLARCGWSREFGMRDRNHFMHDGRTFTVRGEDSVRVVAGYLNARHLGRQTNAVVDGKADEDFIWLLQTAGRADGIYSNKYRIDGDWSPVKSSRTRNIVYPHYWKVLWAS